MGFGLLESTTGIAIILGVVVFFFGKNKVKGWVEMFKETAKNGKEVQAEMKA